MKKAIEASKDIVSRKEAMQSLRRFNLEPERFATYTDEYIINQFRVRVPNVGLAEVQDLRGHLWKIGAYRQSQSIMDAAGDSMYWLNLWFQRRLTGGQSSKHTNKLCHGWEQKPATVMIKSLPWQD